jgi:cbb3-type cytochrome oxidase cytochrome c subunit
VKKLYPNAIIIKGKNHLQQKFIQLGSELLDVDFDVLVKIDLDAILFNYQEVLDIASKCPPESILGNKRTLGDRIYIRGGCNACHASVIKRFVIKGFHQTFKGMDFDIPFCIQSKANLVDYQIFEISEKYSGKLPVWHPLQNTTKLIQFRKCIEIYNKENNQ